MEARGLGPSDKALPPTGSGPQLLKGDERFFLAPLKKIGPLYSNTKYR